MTLRFFVMAIIFDKNLSDTGKSPFIFSVGKNLIECLYKKGIVFSLVSLLSSSLEVLFFYIFSTISSISGLEDILSLSILVQKEFISSKILFNFFEKCSNLSIPIKAICFPL